MLQVALLKCELLPTGVDVKQQLPEIGSYGSMNSLWPLDLSSLKCLKYISLHTMIRQGWCCVHRLEPLL